MNYKYLFCMRARLVLCVVRLIILLKQGLVQFSTSNLHWSDTLNAMTMVHIHIWHTGTKQFKGLNKGLLPTKNNQYTNSINAATIKFILSHKLINYIMWNCFVRHPGHK